MVIKSVNYANIKALNSVSDHPEQIFKFVIQFEREEGTLEELDLALQKVERFYFSALDFLNKIQILLDSFSFL